jgi:KUP system potassium uptake protein
MSNSSTDSSTSTSVKLLVLGALGVVYGDIGTSPLYALRETVAHFGPDQLEAGVLGALSLIFWSLILIVSVKYLLFVTRADNRGEGGIFALLALSLSREERSGPRELSIGLIIILCGAALLYGEGVITPAISVVSAAEGFKTLHPAFAPGPNGTNALVISIAILILAGVFVIQRRGTEWIGGYFGPVMFVWFVTLGTLGFIQILKVPEVLAAVNPMHGLRLLQQSPVPIGLLLGSVVLAITGVEALYTDMGHFGRRAILIGWYGIVLPGLWLNYMGQGALALQQKDMISNALAQGMPMPNLFYLLAPEGAVRYFLVGLAICATVIACQALISGTFSLTRQAIQLGLFPRLAVLHTNKDQRGQIYVPLANWFLAIGAIATVIGFKTSSNLAAAYGIAVTGAMTVTTFAFSLVLRRKWRWPVWRAALLCGGFLVLDLGYFTANLGKIREGGWLPIAIALALVVVMTTWKRGRAVIQEKVYGAGDSEVELAAIAQSRNIVRVPGSAVFMATQPKGTPLALLHHLKAHKALQKTAILMSVVTEDVPSIAEISRVGLEDCGAGVYRVVVRYGYMESPDLEAIVDRLRQAGLPIEPMSTTYYFNREMIVGGGNTRLFEWEKAIYAFLSRNARPAKDYYKVPPSQIIELGLPVQL